MLVCAASRSESTSTAAQGTNVVTIGSSWAAATKVARYRRERSQ